MLYYNISVLRAGLAINVSGVIRISLRNEHESLQSDQTFLWAVFNGEQEKSGFLFFVVADQLSNAWIAGLLLELGLLLHCNRFLSPGLP